MAAVAAESTLENQTSFTSRWLGNMFKADCEARKVSNCFFPPFLSLLIRV
uniref:Uncharacterized protein n=1 Tax=Octopus bimaculoides TaxID=37653 RepID=A0A0L8IDF1_OCTBM